MNLVSEPARLHIENPPIRGDMAYFAGIRVYYTAGYEADSIPESIKMGIMMHAGYLHEHRGENVEGAMRKSGAQAMYRQHRIWTGL